MNNEKTIPTYMENRIDVKSETIIMFTSLIKDLTEGAKPLLGSSTRVILLTTIGQVEGKLRTLFDQDTDTDDLAQQINAKLLRDKNEALALSEGVHKEAPSIVNNSGLIVVVDATLKPFSNPSCTYNYKILNLFADQIVGFTFADS